MYDIDIKNLSVYYGSVCAIQDINLRVENKEFLGVIGPNGGGKTTLIKAILGLLNPSTGSIHIKGNEPIGYVPQFAFFDRSFPINVLDVILMGRLPKKIIWFQKYSNRDKKLAEKIMHELGILELKNRQISQLSGGQLQKVLIARALLTDPKILILDEPTASLDSKTKKEIYRILEKLNNDITIIIVTHEMEDILSYLDSVAYVNKTLSYHKKNSEFNNEEIKRMYKYPFEVIKDKTIMQRELSNHREDINDSSNI